MSVINQMLRDLDARHASEQERAGLPPGLRTLPPRQLARGGEWRILAVGMIAGAVIAGLAASWYFSAVATPVAPPAPAVRPPAPAVPPAPTFRPAETPAAAGGDVADMKLTTQLAEGKSEPAAPAPAQPAAAPAAPAAKEAAPAAAKAATPAKPALPEKAPPRPAAPAEPHVPAPPAKPTPEPAKPAAEAVRSAPAKVAAEPAKPAAGPRDAKPAAPVSPSEADSQIDKRAKGGAAHELADGEYRKGMLAVKRGDGGSAMSQFKRALELDPGFAKARQALLSVLVGNRQWSDARQIAQDGLALDPTQSGWATILARLQFEQGDAAGAIDTLERYAIHAGGDADYQGLFAYLLQKQQRPAEAAQRFRTALALRPGEGRWWFGLGLALESAGQAAEAKEAYAKAKAVGNLPPDMLSVVEQKTK